MSFRATSDRKQTTEQEVKLLYAGHPQVSAGAPPQDVTEPELKVSGGLNVVSKKRRFAVRIFVREPKTGQVREFDPTPNNELTAWDAGITLFPGENQLGHIIRSEDNRVVLRQEWPGLVKYARPPVVVGGKPLEIGTGTSGTLAMAVVSASSLPPELLVHGVSCGANTSSKPMRVFGASLWMMSADCVPANPAEKRLLPLSVVARNTEREGAAIEVPVRGEVVVPIEPATIDLKYNGNPLSLNQRLEPVSDPNQTFELRVRSDVKLTRVEVFQGTGPNAQLERIEGVSAKLAVPAGRGFELIARPTVQLRPGFENYFRVEAENGGQPVSFGFFATYTPPPASVVIDSIEEAPQGKPNGKVTQVTPENANALQVGPGVVLVRGRVTWLHNDEPIGKDRHLSVVFVANGVSHLPIPVSSAVPGAGRERTFVGYVYLNSPDPTPKAPGKTVVRAELRSAMLAMPQLDVKRASMTVSSREPTVKQRLHVLIVGVGVPEADRAQLVRRVVTSIGGEIPANNPNFTEGVFKRNHFALAQVYRPQFGYVQTGHLNTMLERVRADIAERSERRGEEWVNDVILLYYQGKDWRDEKSGRWLLHTASTLNVRPGTAPPPEQAIRPDSLPRLPGMTVVVANVVGAKIENDPLTIDVPYLRYAWESEKTTDVLLAAIQQAVKQERTVEQIGTSVHADVIKVKGIADGVLPQVVQDRVVGLKTPAP